MPIRILSVLLFVTALAISPARADVARELNWNSLVPPQSPLKHPFAGLVWEVRFDLQYLANIRYWTKSGQISEKDSEFKHGLELAKKLTDKGVDFESYIPEYNSFLDEVEKRNRAVVDELDGQLVRIPGYALPLELEGTAVKEFLLVPTVGACIHTPVPPANQMVHVKLNQSYLVDALYAPVWVTGRIKVQQTSRAVSYTDGKTGVETAYTLEDVDIKPYKRRDN